MQDQAMNKALLEAIDWIQRTGWPTRRADEGEACEIFDAWWDDVRAGREPPEAGRRASLRDALYRAFESRHGVTVAEHLCAVFDAVFWVHAQSRQDTGWNQSEVPEPSMPDDSAQRLSHRLQEGCTVPSTPTRIRLDHRFWIHVLIGLPVLASLILLMAAIGWWAQAAPAVFGPPDWLADPLMAAGWAVAGGIIAFFAIATAVVACWIAFALGTGILGAIQLRKDSNKPHPRGH